MKYYVYVSDTKLDMLYPQIPQGFLKKISAELGINLPFVSLSLKERKDDLQSQQTARYQKLDVVTNYITNNFSVGTIDNPNEYFEGTLDMIWGPYGAENSPLVFFGGKTNDTWVGLAGSSHHLIGSNKDQTYIHSMSMTYSVAAELKKRLEAPVLPGEKTEFKKMRNIDALEKLLGDVVLAVSSQARYGSEAIPQKIEFLAKKLNSGIIETSGLTITSTNFPSSPLGKKENVLFGTPIYVALVN